MSRKYFVYKLLLHILESLVYAKRFLFWIGRKVSPFGKHVRSLYKRTIGFHVYKAFFYSGKFLRKHILVHKYSRFEVLGQRGALQLILFLVIFFIMFPQSKLYTKEYTHIPGRATLLYKLVGPGDQDFSYEEVSGVDVVQNAAGTDAAGWKQGAVIVNSNQGAMDSGSQDIASVSVGGSAVTKPIIAPGADVEALAAEAAAGTQDRDKVIVYEVQPGDVVGNIASRYGISVETILAANDLTARSYIRPGDKLKILPVDGITYTVASGDTVYKIASKYDADADDIIAFNKLRNDGSDIVVGEELVLPGGRAPQPVRTVIVKNTQPPKNNALQNVVAPPPSISAPAGSGYIWPTAATIITQYYGWRHTGLDIAADTGTPIYAARAGTVIKSQCGWNGGYGCYTIIDHGGGLTTLYAHASKLYVGVGEVVSQGQTISLMGSTGRSTGPHVHFEVRVNGQHVNPLKYVRK